MLCADDLDISCCWSCLHSPRSYLLIFFSGSMCTRKMFSLFSHVCGLLTISLIHPCMKVVELVDRYDTDCVPESSRGNKVAYIQGQGDKMCNRTITVDIFFYTVVFSCYGSFTDLFLFLQVTKTMKHPVYVYYQLENFYQNHRRYFPYLLSNSI